MINKILLAFLFVFFIFGANAQKKDSISADVLLSLSLEDLLSMKIITAGKKYEEVKDVPANATVITRKDIERLGFTTYTEILQHINGFYMIDDYYWLGSVNYGVRGFFSTGPFNNVIILVNGINQMSDKYSDYPDVKINVPIEAIDRIEIIKGPMSVIYGSGAFFGAINIITNNVEENKTKNIASVSYGSLNTSKIGLKLSGKEEKFKYVFNASMYNTNGIDVPFTDLTTNPGVINYVGLTPDATTAGQFDDNRKHFSLFLEHKDLFFDISYIETQKDIFDGQPSFGDGSLMTTKASNIFLGYKKTFNDKISAEIKAGYYSHSHILDYEIFRPYYYEIDGQTSNAYSLELNAFFNISEKLEATIGLNRRKVLNIFQVSDFGYYGLNLGHGEVGLPRGEQYSTNSAFTQVKFKAFKKLSIIGGIRIEYLEAYNMQYARGIITENPIDNRPVDSTELRRIYLETYYPENNGISIIPNLAAIFYINDQNVVKLLYGHATKQPSFSENYRQLPGGRPLLDAATIQTIELNYILDIESTFIFNLSLFNNQLKNLISSTNIYNQDTGDWDIYSANSGQMETYGVETGIKYAPFYRLQMNLSGTYQKSKNKLEGYENITLGYSPTFLAYGNVSYQIYKNVSVSVIGRYIDKMETLWKTESTPENGSRIGNSIPAYYVMDANFRMNKIANTGLFFNMKATNIFDTEIRYPTTTSNTWMDKGALGRGRNFLISIGYNF